MGFLRDFKYTAYAPHYDFFIAPSTRIDEPIQYSHYDDANDDPTDTSPKQGITAGPYTNEDLESDGALPTDQLHAEVALRPTTQPAKRPASSSSRVKASNEKATTILPVILTMETTSGWPFIGCEPSVTHAQSDDAKPHAPRPSV